MHDALMPMMILRYKKFQKFSKSILYFSKQNHNAHLCVYVIPLTKVCAKLQMYRETRKVK